MRACRRSSSGARRRRDALDAVHSELKALEADKDDAADALSKRSKYAAIREREAKMAALVADFPQLSGSLQDASAQARRQVVTALQALSSERAKGRQIGDSAAMSELSAEVTFKASKLRSSADTIAALRKERTRRTDELEKIGHLDGKITAELAQLKAQMRDMRAEIGRFRDEEQWKAFHTSEKRRLTLANAALQRDIAALCGASTEAEAALAARQRSAQAALQATGMGASREAEWQALAAEVAALEQFVGAPQARD